jgi:quercetin dioxygenase-like cupin family protein
MPNKLMQLYLWINFYSTLKDFLMQTTQIKAALVAAGEGEKINLLGNAITVKLSSRQTDGNYYVFECITPPGHGVPAHVHTLEDELIYVQEGEFSILLGENQYKAYVGDFIFFPRNVPHAFQNTGIKAGKLLMTAVPGGNFEKFFDALAVLPSGNQDMQKIVDTFAAYGMDVLVGKETHL